MTFFYTYQNHTFQMYHYVSFNMALFSLLFPWHSRFFFEGFSLNIVFFYPRQQSLILQMHHYVSIEIFFLSSRVYMFWVKHQFISACFKHTGKKKHTKDDFSIIFSQILLFPTRTFFHGFATHTCFQKLKMVLTRVPSGQTHIETQKLTSSFTLGTSKL